MENVTEVLLGNCFPDDFVSNLIEMGTVISTGYMNYQKRDESTTTALKMKLLETTQLGNLALKNRMVMSAMTRSRAYSQGIRLYLTSWNGLQSGEFSSIDKRVRS